MQFYKTSVLISSLLFSPLLFAANDLSNSLAGPFHLNTDLYIFAADIDGSISDGNLDYKVRQPFHETVKNLDHFFMGRINLSKGDWGIYIDQQLVKTTENKQVLQYPIALKTKLTQTSYGLYYQAYRSPVENINQRPKLTVEPTIGIHHTEAKATLGAFGLSKTADMNWNEFFWGTRLRYNFDSPWNVASEITAGAKDTLLAQAYLGYNVAVFNRDINLYAGYRYFKQDYRSGNFHWNIHEQGPVLGLNIPIF